MKPIKISNNELQTMGCKNCIWKTHNQCPHNEDSPDGICKEYLDFILGFAEEGESVNVLWEKFSLYISRLQSLDDYKSFLKLRDEVDKKKKEGLESKEEFKYDIQLNTLRTWWQTLNDTVRKGYGRIADRESNEKETGKQAGILSARTINFNIEHKEGDKLEDKRK